MKTVRRLGRRGRCLSTLSEQKQRVLRCRLESFKHLQSSTLDEIVRHLLENYGDYQRGIKQPILKRFVQQTLDSPFLKRSKTEPHISQGEEEHGQRNSHKMRKREAEFDLTKSILRSSYTESNRVVKPKAYDGDRVEILSKSIGPGPETSPKRNGNCSSLRDVEVKRSEGPRFSDLGGMKKVLALLERDVILPLCQARLAKFLGARPVPGILFHGPPGCGKTILAHAIANETGIPFYKISASDVVSGVSGVAEENIRELFSKAYRTAPSIVFIDEIDAIASKRDNLRRTTDVQIVTQLMACMDESQSLVQPADANSNSQSSDHRPGHVVVIGATNRPDALDRALRKPGRFELEIVLGPPDENARIEIISLLARNLRLEGSFDVLKIARSTSGFVGADLVALAHRASNIALKRVFEKAGRSIYSMNEECDEDWWLSQEMEKPAVTMSDFEEAIQVLQPSLKREGFTEIPNVQWEDVGGLDSLRKEFYSHIVRRIKYPEIYERFGLDLETGFLLYGPPGCGKTLIAKAVANEAGANFMYVKGPEILNKYVGESELQVRTIFSRARMCSPCIVFFDELDALTTTRGTKGGSVVEGILNQLLVELDGAEQRLGVFVIGATNRPDVLDPAVLRPGRFGKHIYVPLPTKDERCLILKALGRKKPVDPSFDLSEIGQSEACENFSGADLSALMNQAATIASEESSSDASSWIIKETHFEKAFAKITPSIQTSNYNSYQKFGKRRQKNKHKPQMFHGSACL